LRGEHRILVASTNPGKLKDCCFLTSVLIRKDADKKQTKGGIQLPDNIEIPTITGRIITISAEVEHSPDIPLRQYDKVLFNPKGAIPVDFEGDNRLFVVEIENVVAVFRKS